MQTNPFQRRNHQLTKQQYKKISPRIYTRCLLYITHQSAQGMFNLKNLISNSIYIIKEYIMHAIILINLKQITITINTFDQSYNINIPQGKTKVSQKTHNSNPPKSKKK